MSKLARKIAKIFGSTASSGEIAKFGSLAASAPVTYSGATADVATIQSLSNWLAGWNAAQVGAGSPAIEDMNAVCFVLAYQIAYLMQQGIAEWDSGTTYFVGSVVTNGTDGTPYYSIQNTNLNHAVTDTSWWLPYANLIGNTRTRNVTTNGTDPGLGGVSISTSCGTAFTNSGTYADVTNLSCILTTSGRPVSIGFIGDGTVGGVGSTWEISGTPNNASNQNFGFVKLLRASTAILETSIYLDNQANGSGEALRTPCSVISFTDTPAAGTYTYKAQFKSVSSNVTSPQFNANLMKMIIFEID